MADASDKRALLERELAEAAKRAAAQIVEGVEIDAEPKLALRIAAAWLRIPAAARAEMKIKRIIHINLKGYENHWSCPNIKDGLVLGEYEHKAEILWLCRPAAEWTPSTFYHEAGHALFLAVLDDLVGYYLDGGKRPKHSYGFGSEETIEFQEEGAEAFREFMTGVDSFGARFYEKRYAGGLKDDKEG